MPQSSRRYAIVLWNLTNVLCFFPISSGFFFRSKFGKPFARNVINISPECYTVRLRLTGAQLKSWNQFVNRLHIHTFVSSCEPSQNVGKAFRDILEKGSIGRKAQNGRRSTNTTAAWTDLWLIRTHQRLHVDRSQREIESERGIECWGACKCKSVFFSSLQCCWNKNHHRKRSLSRVNVDEGCAPLYELTMISRMGKLRHGRSNIFLYPISGKEESQTASPGCAIDFMPFLIW